MLVAHTVARLLMPEITGRELFENRGAAVPRWQCQESVAGDVCAIVLLADNRTEIAVRERDFAIRRIITPGVRTLAGGRRADLITNYEATIVTDASPTERDG